MEGGREGGKNYYGWNNVVFYSHRFSSFIHSLYSVSCLSTLGAPWLRIVWILRVTNCKLSNLTCTYFRHAGRNRCASDKRNAQIALNR